MRGAISFLLLTVTLSARVTAGSRSEIGWLRHPGVMKAWSRSGNDSIFTIMHNQLHLSSAYLGAWRGFARWHAHP
jgi:hypothetical protein